MSVYLASFSLAAFWKAAKVSDAEPDVRFDLLVGMAGLVGVTGLTGCLARLDQPFNGPLEDLSTCKKTKLEIINKFLCIKEV